MPFLSFRRQQTETKAATLTDDAALQIFGITPTASGINVSATAAMKVPAVACGVGLISETMGTLPASLHLDASNEALTDHPAHRLIHKEANPWTSAAQLREQLTLDALLHGAGHAIVTRNNQGEPLELHRLPNGHCQLHHEPDGTPFFLVTQDGKNQRRYDYTDVLRVEAFGGVSPISLAREAIGLALQFEKHMSGVFANGGRPSGVIKSPKSLDTDAKKNLAASWFNTHGGDKAGSTALLDEGMQYQQLSMSLADTQFAENRLEQIREIARALRVPPTLLFELTRGTWSNTEQMMRQFLTLTLRPWIETWVWAYARCLMTPEERTDISVRFDTESLLSADHAVKANSFSQYRAMGAMTANEVRASLNLPEKDGGNSLDNPFTSTNAKVPATGIAADDPSNFNEGTQDDSPDT